MRVYFTNLGCKLNQAELEALARRFAGAGHRIAPVLAEADLHVVNSCTVTHVAARDSRRLARRGRRLNPAIKTVLTGCHATAEPHEAAALAGVDLVVANADKDALLDRVHEAFPAMLSTAAELPIPYVPLEFGNARALVKVEDGCNMRCSFCIIPLTRGRQRSRSVDEVVAEVGALAGAGFPEVVVTGVQISSYRWRDAGLYELVEALLERTDVDRLRLTSIAPWQFDLRLAELAAGGRVCRHFHLSLQSGCDATLRSMRRPYTAAAFAELVATLRARVPGVAITTDVIAGFPGESDEEFEESLAFVASVGFARVHAFGYSPRPGTEAASLPGQVEPGVRKERVRRLREVGRASERRFHAAQIGETVDVLWERSKDGLWRGTTDHYIPVHARSGRNLDRRLTPARLIELADGAVLGRPLRSQGEGARRAVGRLAQIAS